MVSVRCQLSIGGDDASEVPWYRLVTQCQEEAPVLASIPRVLHNKICLLWHLRGGTLAVGPPGYLIHFQFG